MYNNFVILSYNPEYLHVYFSEVLLRYFVMIIFYNCNIVIGTMTRLQAGQSGNCGFTAGNTQGFFSIITHPEWGNEYREFFSWEPKQPGHESYHSHLVSSLEYVDFYLHSSISLQGVHRNNFTPTFKLYVK